MKASTGRTFGGYHSVALPKNETTPIKDPSAFMFSLSHCQIFELKDKDGLQSIQTNPELGPVFGGVNPDLWMVDKFSTTECNTTSFGNYFQLP